VRAVNASGPGKPSDTSEPVLVEARPGEPAPLAPQNFGGYRTAVMWGSERARCICVVSVCVLHLRRCYVCRCYVCYVCVMHACMDVCLDA
jgi:hypothetical protein